MELEELERNLFARYGGTATGKTVTSGNVVAKVAEIAVAKSANERITEAELKAFQYDENTTSQKDMSATEIVRYMQAEIALFHGEAIAFIARYLQKHYGKTYWQAQDTAATIFDIMRETHIRNALGEGQDDAAERLLQECREKFGMPDYLATATASAVWLEHASDSLH